MIMARMGLNDNRCRMVTQFVDVMFISSTAFLILCWELPRLRQEMNQALHVEPAGDEVFDGSAPL